MNIASPPKISLDQRYCARWRSGVVRKCAAVTCTQQQRTKRGQKIRRGTPRSKNETECYAPLVIPEVEEIAVLEHKVPTDHTVDLH